MTSWRALFRTLLQPTIADERNARALIRAISRLTRLLFLPLLFQISCAPATAQDLRVGYPQQYTMSPKSVNLQTGRLTYQQTDLSIGALKLTRMWGTGGSSLVSGFGVATGGGSGWNFGGWTHNYSSSIYIDNSTNTPYYRVTVEGTQYTFKNASGLYVAGDATTQGMTLTTSGGQWVMTDHSGNQYTFSGSPILLQSVLYANGSTVAITYNGGTQPKLISSNLGYAIVLDYNANQTISTVCGYNTTQTYVTSSTTCAGGPVVKVSYGYDSTPRLISITDARFGVTSISYEAAGTVTNPSCISLVNSSTCAIQNAYGETMMSFPDQVTTQTTAAGNIWHYVYYPPENPVDVPQQPCRPYWSRSEMTDAAGRGYAAIYDRGYLTRLQAPEGNTKYLYPNGCATYGGNGTAPVSVEVRLPRPSLVRKPGGIREYYEYDLRGNATKRAVFPIGVPDPLTTNGGQWIPSDPTLAECCLNLGTPIIPSGSLIYQTSYLPDYGVIAISGQSYSMGCGAGPSDVKRCDKPITITDPNNNVTTFTYAPEHGGVLTETSPAVNGVTPQTRYAYLQRQAWLKTAGGGLAQSGQNVWLLASKNLCKTSSWNGTECSAGAGDRVTTTYDYGPNDGSAPNNLLLRSVVVDDGGLNLRTCYKYDAQGNKISETKPRGAISACPL